MSNTTPWVKTFILSVALGTLGQAQAGDIKTVVPEIKAIAARADVLAAVKAQNAKSLSLDAIKALDGKWTATSGNLPEGKAMLDAPISKALLSAEKTKPYFKESILTDNQGANVGISSMTSDYWQGDEPKFVSAFADGAGSDYVARPKKDDSSGEVIAQVSVPVMDGGKAIGTLTVGVLVQAIP